MKPPGPSTQGTARAIWVTIAATSLGVLAPFLVGALSVLMQRDFAIGPQDIGLAVGAFFTVAGVVARVQGRMVERIGTAPSLGVATAVATAALLMIATAGSWTTVVLGLVLGGTASAMIHPATAQLLADSVGDRRLGLAFGFKQSGAPVSTMLAGLAVPAVGLSIGWRPTFLIASGVVLAVGSTLVSLVKGAVPSPYRSEGHGATRPHRGLWLLALGAGLGNAGGNALAALLVDGGVRFSGVTEATAGYTLGAVSAGAILVRIGLGVAVDRGRADSDRLLVWMPGLGVIGATVLAFPSPASFVVGAAVAYPIGWGWSGLLHHRVVAPQRHAAARMTGVLMTGFSLGAAGGPLMLGFVAHQTSYRLAWISTGLLFALSAAAIRSGRKGPSLRPLTILS